MQASSLNPVIAGSYILSESDPPAKTMTQEVQHEAYSFRRGRKASIAKLPSEIMASLLSRIDSGRDRNACALVCRAWRSWERETRTRLHLRGSIINLEEIRNSFRSVTDLDLTDVNPGWEGSEEELRDLFSTSFPNVRRVKANVSPSGLQYVRHCWRELREVVIGHWDGPDDFLEAHHVRALLESCPHIFSVDLSWSRNCDFNDLPRELASLKFHGLRALNLLGGPSKLWDSTLEGLVSVCPRLQELCFSIGDGSVTDEGIEKLAAGCTDLRNLSIEDMGHDINDEHDATGPITAKSVIALAKNCSKLRALSLVLAFYVRRSGAAFELLGLRCKDLQTLRLARFLGLCKGEQTDVAAVAFRGRPGGAGLRSSEVRGASGLNRGAIIGRVVDRGLEGAVGGRMTANISGGGVGGTLLPFPSSSGDGVDIGTAAHGASGTAKGWEAGPPKYRGVAMCTNLTDLEMQSCKDLVDADVQSILGACTQLRRLQIMANQKLTSKALNPLASGASGPGMALEHVRVLQCDKVATVNALERLGSLKDRISGLELTCSWLPTDHPSQIRALPLANFSSLLSLYLQMRVGSSLQPLAEAGLETCTTLKYFYLTLYGEVVTFSPWMACATNLSFLAQIPSLEFFYLALERVGGPKEVVDVWEKSYMKWLPSLGLPDLEYHPPPLQDGMEVVSLQAARCLASCPSLRRLSLGGVVKEEAMVELLHCKTLRDATFHLPPDCSDVFRQDFYTTLTSRTYADQVRVRKRKAGSRRKVV